MDGDRSYGRTGGVPQVIATFRNLTGSLLPRSPTRALVLLGVYCKIERA